MSTYHLLIVFFVLEYVRPGTYFPPISILHLNSLVPLFVIFKMFKDPGVPTGEAFKDNKYIVSLLALIVLAIPTSQSSGSAFTTFTTVSGYVMIGVAITKFVTDVRKIKGIFAVLVIVHLVLAALTPQMLLDAGTRHYVASGTFLGDGNDYALSVNIAIPFNLFLLFDAPNMRKKLFWGFTLLILVLCVVATQSRGGTMALAFVGVYYWFKSERKLMTGALAVATIIAVLLFAPPKYFERMNSIASFESDGSAQGRISAWGASMGMALSNPLLGVGAGQFPANFTRFAGGDNTRWMTAHSIYFLLLGELGVPGLGLLLALIFGNLAANRVLVREIRARGSPASSRYTQLLASMSVSLIAFAIAGAFLSAIYYPHVYVLSGLLAAARRIARQDEGTVLVPAGKPAVKLPVLKTVRPRVRDLPATVTANENALLEKNGRFF